MADEVQTPEAGTQVDDQQQAPPAPQGDDRLGKGELPSSHSQLNALLAKHKQNLQNELSQTKQTATERERAFLELKKQVEQFTEGAPVEDFMKGVEATLSKLDSDAEKANKEAKRTAKALEEAQNLANDYKTRWTRDRIGSAIDRAAGPKAVSEAAARLIGKDLFDKAVVKDDGSVVFPMDIADEDGDVETKELSATEAVEILERDVTNYGTLFKSTVNSGAGSEVDGLSRTKEGSIDIGNLSFEEHMKLKRENPALYERLVRGEG